MMQSVPAHTYASWDALHYLVINYILLLSGKTSKNIKFLPEVP